jgi:hypothetical protein
MGGGTVKKSIGGDARGDRVGDQRSRDRRNFINDGDRLHLDNKRIREVFNALKRGQGERRLLEGIQTLKKGPPIPTGRNNARRTQRAESPKNTSSPIREQIKRSREAKTA